MLWGYSPPRARSPEPSHGGGLAQGRPDRPCSSGPDPARPETSPTPTRVALLSPHAGLPPAHHCLSPDLPVVDISDPWNPTPFPHSQLVYFT